MIPAGLSLLALFLFGGKVAGAGKPDHIASAARAFLGPWLLIVLGNVWVRWWSGYALLSEALWLVPVALVPMAAAFLAWRKFARR